MKNNRLIITYLFLLSGFIQSAYSQKQNQNFLITYNTYSNGINTSKNNAILLIANDSTYFRFNENELTPGQHTFPYEQTYANTQSNTNHSLAQLSTENRLKTVLPHVERKYTLHDETKNILGLKAKKATIVINSNHITIWYTNDLKIKGSPNILGSELGLVLEHDRNGTYAIKAEKIDRNTNESHFNLVKFEETPLVEHSTYNLALFNSRFTTVPLFKDELVNFNTEHTPSEGVHRYGDGTLIIKKVKFPTITPESQLFLSVKEQSNGDAYDRTGTVFLIPTEAGSKPSENFFEESEKVTSIELMRFFTPFGVGKYNHINFLETKWQEDIFYRQEISEFTSLLSGQEWYIGISIGNYDQGGHKVSAEFTIHPGSIKSEQFTKTIPVFNTSLMVDSPNYKTIDKDEKGLTVHFTLEQSLKNAKLRYVTTGHGGWGGGDEFNQKLNTLLLDQRKILEFIPWRTDCGSYRDYNPASGNFSNGLSSSDLSRSNWCPGTITFPQWITLGDLEAGDHTLQIKIPIGASEGNSSSSWYLSGTLFGD